MSTMPLGGPMFEPADDANFKKQRCSRCRQTSMGAHYSLFQITGGIEALKAFFPEGEADEMNFVLFSTSGVHGTYTTIEDIEESLKLPIDDENRYTELTIEIIQPRICCLRYGTMDVRSEDIPFLKKLRQSSWDAVQKIGAAK